MAGSSTHDGGRWSLRELMRERLTHEMLDQFAHEPTGLVLCVDAVTLSIVSSAFRMSELLERNVHLVENVTMVDDAGNYLRRQRLPQLPVLYFLTPAVESVNRLLDDYRDARNPMYGACHLFWSSRLSDALFAKIKASPLIQSVAACKEINLEMCCRETNVFTINCPPCHKTFTVSSERTNA